MGFLRLLRPWEFSHEARRGPQGASCATPGNSCLHAHGEGERDMALESREGTRAWRRVEEGLSWSFSGGSGNPSFPSPSAGDLGNFPGCLSEARDPLEVAGPLGTPLGLAQRKRSSSGWEARTSGFLSVLDSDCRVPAQLGQESQASSCLRKGTPLASGVALGVSGPSSSCVWNTRVFPDDAR